MLLTCPQAGEEAPSQGDTGSQHMRQQQFIVIGNGGSTDPLSRDQTTRSAIRLAFSEEELA